MNNILNSINNFFNNNGYKPVETNSKKINSNKKKSTITDICEVCGSIGTIRHAPTGPGSGCWCYADYLKEKLKYGIY